MTSEIEGYAWKYTFKSRGSSDSEWRTLWSYTSAVGTGGGANAMLGGGFAVISLSDVIMSDDGESGHLCLISVNLKTDETMEIVSLREKVNSENYLLLGVSDGQAFVVWTGFDKEIMQSDEYIREAVGNGDITAEDALSDWARYLQDSRLNKFLLIDLITGAETEIAADTGRALPLPNTLAAAYNGSVYYHHGDSIMAYSLQSGESRELMRASGVINVFAYDGRVFYITGSDSEGYDHYCYDLESGAVYQLASDAETGPAVFNIQGENATMFMGTSGDGGFSLIKKTDFYNGDYDKIISMR